MTQATTTDGKIDTDASLEDSKENIVIGKQIIPFNKPHLFAGSLDAIQESFAAGKASGDGINTKRVTRFFASPQFFAHDRVLLTPSCTAALEMAALVLDLGKGDEVIVPSFTFVSTANAFALRGVDLVFADSESASDFSNPDRPNTPNVDVQDILRKVTPKTKAIVVVQYAGITVDLRPLLHLGIPIVEDCAHALGSIDATTQRHTGLVGCLSTFSFHDTKNIGIGEGGCLVVNDPQLWERASVCREKGTNHAAFREGRVLHYHWQSLGSSYLMSDVDAGVLWACLLHYDSIQLRRIQIWDFYHDRIWSTSNLWWKPSRRVSRTNGHMYYLQFYDPHVRREFQQFMKQRGIVVTSHYQPLDTSPFVRKDLKGEGPAAVVPPHCCKNARLWSETIVRLPLYFELTTEQQVRIVDAINSFTVDKARTENAEDGNKKNWTLRPATPEFWEDIRQIRNVHRFGFGQTDIIDVATHRSFMQKNWRTYRVAVAVDDDGVGQRVIGFVGRVRDDVRMATHPDYMRRGVGKFLNNAFAREILDYSRQSRRDNPAALALNRKFGYVPDPKDWASGSEIVRLIPIADQDPSNDRQVVLSRL